MTPRQHNQALADAFEAFNQMSVQLETSYRELEVRVAELNNELAAARSERLQQLAEKERLADRLQTLLGALPAGVLVLDGTERVRECNRVAEDQLGEPLVGEHWHAVSARAFSIVDGQAAEVRLHDGRRLNIASRLLDNEPGRILVLHDVTETQALQDAVNRQQRLGAMGEMAASLAHQIRTPLSAAVLYAAHLAKDQLPMGDRGRFAARLTERLGHLERLVNDMLAFARGGSGGDEQFRLETLVDELHQAMENQLQAAGASWRVRNAALNARICGNKDALLGALSNLITNSLQAIPTAPALELQAAFSTQGEIEIRLRDNGPGIPDELQERIFEPFFTTRPGGTGLGLAVVQATLRAHHGSIRVQSASGGGTEFVLTLPEANLSSGLPSRQRPNYLSNAASMSNAACDIN